GQRPARPDLSNGGEHRTLQGDRNLRSGANHAVPGNTAVRGDHEKLRPESGRSCVSRLAAIVGGSGKSPEAGAGRGEVKSQRKDRKVKRKDRHETLGALSETLASSAFILSIESAPPN